MLGINPLAIPALYTFAVLGGAVTPGVAQVTGFSRSWDWDVKKGKGSKGASVTAQGSGLSKGTIKLLLWRRGLNGEPDDFADWDTFREYLLQQIETGGSKGPKALDLAHPVTTDLGISSVVIEEIGQLVHEGKQLYSVTIKLLEYRQPAPSGGTPSSSKATTWTSGAKSQQEKDLEALAKQAGLAV